VLGSTKEQRANRRHLWSGAPDCPVHHRTVSGAPPDMSGAPEDSNSNSPPSGISRGTRAIIHRTVRCTPDSVQCAKEEWPQELASFGNLQRLVRYNSPDMSGVHRTVRCTPDSVRCAKEERPQELASFGKLQRLVCYNSPDMSGVHRTVRCNSGATAISAPTATCGALNARAARAEVRRAHTGTPDKEQYMSGVHRTSRRAHKPEAPTVRIQRQ
jgi:hypothetical protein